MRNLCSVLALAFTIAIPASAQVRHPGLPDLTFAPVVALDRFTGNRWSYMEAGRSDAPPIVLLHGIGGTSMDWRYPKTSPQLMAIIRNSARAVNPSAFRQAVRFTLTDGYSPDEVAAKERAPVLMIAGSEDHVSPIPTNAALLKKAIPSARLEVLNEIGHLPHLEAPDRVNALLLEFFTR